MELVSEAILFATRAHDGMRRKKSESPYVLHPMEAMAIVGTMTDDQHIIAAAALHDVVEDAGIPLEQVEESFGPRVRELVQSETENKREDRPPAETWQLRKEESLQVLRQTEDMGVRILWLGDKLANMRAIYRDWKKDGNALWLYFHQKDPKAQAWYYKTIAELTRQLSHTAAWVEYKALTDIVFGKGEVSG